jgi:hypothetical protein
MMQSSDSVMKGSWTAGSRAMNCSAATLPASFRSTIPMNTWRPQLIPKTVQSGWKPYLNPTGPFLT